MSKRTDSVTFKADWSKPPHATAIGGCLALGCTLTLALMAGIGITLLWKLFMWSITL